MSLIVPPVYPFFFVSGDLLPPETFQTLRVSLTILDRVSTFIIRDIVYCIGNSLVFKRSPLLMIQFNVQPNNGENQVYLKPISSN